MNAHPPRTRWHVETYDPVAREWSSGLPLTDRQTAINKRTLLDATRPTWKDGTAVMRRIVLETTTFEDLDVDTSHLARFPKAGFVLPCVGGQHLAAVPGATADGRPAIRFSVGSSDTGHAEAVVPLDRLEEVIAGLRDMARQTGGQPSPVVPQPPVDQAAFYRALAEKQEATAAADVIRRRRSIATARRLFAVELRRMADEAAR